MDQAVVAATKLRAPGQRADAVARPALVAMLRAGQTGKVTLVAAPPGAGKTTLLAQWQTGDARFAWLALDAAENDPVRFWTGVVEAVRTVEPGVGGSALAALRSPGAGLIDVVVPLLINELVELDEPLVLVLDDLHLVEDARVHESLDFLVEHLPETLHVAIATRVDPPLPLGRLRARGELTEIRTADLRFSDAEATALLNDALGLGLVPDQIARLQQRTEGWAAGLQLAGLSLRGRAEPDAFIASFAGGDRQIVEYLGHEVLERQPAPLRGFLLETAVLERMSADLCNAVTGRDDARRRLDELERANLPLVALDAQRQWFRYHHLFREVLVAELERERPELVAPLHGRAARWHREAGRVADAIGHAFAAREVELATELVATHWSESFNCGELATVRGWLAQLPGDIVDRDSRLWLASVWTSLDSGRLDEAEPLLAAAEGDAERAAWGSLLRALHTFKSGDITAAAAAVEDAVGAWEQPTPFWRTVAALTRGTTAYWAGDVPVAEAALQEAETAAGADGNCLAQLYSLGYLALLRADRGRLDEADAMLARVEEVCEAEPGVEEYFVAMVARLARAEVCERRHRAREAAAEAGLAVSLARRGAGHVEEAAALLAQARSRRALGDREGAALADAAARDVLAHCPDPGRLARFVPPVAAPPVRMRDPLSDRELAVLRLLSSPLSQREIGQELVLSVNTVKTHTRHIYAKLHAGTREQAVGRARELGLL